MHTENAAEALVTLIESGNETVIHQCCCTIFNMVSTTEFRQNIINNKVEVGYEPIRNFIWDKF